MSRAMIGFVIRLGSTPVDVPRNDWVRYSISCPRQRITARWLRSLLNLCPRPLYPRHDWAHCSICVPRQRIKIRCYKMRSFLRNCDVERMEILFINREINTSGTPKQDATPLQSRRLDRFCRDGFQSIHDCDIDHARAVGSVHIAPCL